jgi:hypothetical protein
MKKILIVSPHFPPLSTPDMHRVRISIPFFAEFGWQPVVLAVEPDDTGRERDLLLLESLPSTLPVKHVRAVPASWTRKIGFSDLGLRSLPNLYRAGRELIDKHKVELIYFSTTVFMTMPLGRMWEREFGIPYVLDLQDPWVSDYYEKKAKSERPPKYRLSSYLHRRLESWTMRRVGGIVAVSESYHSSLRQRYDWIPESLCRTIPFGAAPTDLDLAAKCKAENRYFSPGDGLLHGVYVGVLGRVMKQTCEAICLALKKGLRLYPELFSKVRLHFIGTDYAVGAKAKKTITPIARQFGVEDYVREETGRAAYFTGLNLLRDADFLIVPGSDNPSYTASKIYSCILARKPMLAVFHQESSVCRVLKETESASLASFSDSDSVTELADRILAHWADLLRRMPFQPATNWGAFEKYTARELTRAQCALFDEVVAAKASLPGAN